MKHTIPYIAASFISLVAINLVSINAVAGDQVQENEYKEYCDSLAESQMSEEASSQFVEECVQEHLAGVEEMDSVADVDCYVLVDEVAKEVLIENPNEVFDYDELLEECLGKNK